MPGKGSDVRTDYVEPAERGTVAVLEAADGQNTIKKVIVMASVLSLMPLGALASPEFSVTGMYLYLGHCSITHPF